MADNITGFLPNLEFAQQVFIITFKLIFTKTRPAGTGWIYVEKLIDSQHDFGNRCFFVTEVQNT